jgi:uncharacterized protein (TIGR02266 family)
MSLGAIASDGHDWARQQAPRSGRADVEIAVDLHGWHGPTPGVTRNVSPEGAFVATSRLLPVGERVMLMLSVPGRRQPLAVRAEVRWSREAAQVRDTRWPAGMGLRFVDPPLGVSLVMAELVDAQRDFRARVGAR